MELTSKQRAQLRGLANNIDTILIVGKEGIGDNLVQQANEALEARELIKGRVLETSLMSAREAAEALAPRTRSEVVQVIGTKFVLYRPSSIFPGQEKLLSSDRIYEVSYNPSNGQKRIAMTGCPIVNARRVIFLITGRSKAEVVLASPAK